MDLVLLLRDGTVRVSLQTMKQSEHAPEIGAAPESARLRLRVTAAAQRQIRSGHPWLFASSVHEQNRAGTTGELAVIYDRSDQFLALGLFDSASPLRVRILVRGKPAELNPAWWRQRFQSALARRQGLFGSDTTGFRLIHGESDGWPGLVLDRYDQTLVLKLYTSAWLRWLSGLIPMLIEEAAGQRLVLRLSRNIQADARANFGRNDGTIIAGAELSEPVHFLESGLKFEAEVLRGQKTGFFLDQRENRRLVETLSRGREVLNAFSFSSGFSLYAARGGARSVTDVDISAHALQSGARNFALNPASVRECPRQAVQGDVFEWLGTAPEQFDLIVVDPPSLARRESERAGAIEAYARLASSAAARLRPGGVLVAASCSAHVSAPEFFEAVRTGAARGGRRYQELRTTGHPADHPSDFAEAAYLKCLYLQF